MLLHIFIFCFRALFMKRWRYFHLILLLLYIIYYFIIRERLLWWQSALFLCHMPPYYYFPAKSDMILLFIIIIISYTYETLPPLHLFSYMRARRFFAMQYTCFRPPRHYTLYYIKIYTLHARFHVYIYFTARFIFMIYKIYDKKRYAKEIYIFIHIIIFSNHCLLSRHHILFTLFPDKRLLLRDIYTYIIIFALRGRAFSRCPRHVSSRAAFHIIFLLSFSDIFIYIGFPSRWYFSHEHFSTLYMRYMLFLILFLYAFSFHIITYKRQAFRLREDIYIAIAARGYAATPRALKEERLWYIMTFLPPSSAVTLCATLRHAESHLFLILYAKKRRYFYFYYWYRYYYISRAVI